jgi:Domain of unknown function (DUF6438)
VTRALVAVAAAIALAGACGPIPYHPESDAPVVIVLQRDECFGDCPVYSLIIYRDGLVQYDGKEHVDVIGRRTDTIDAATLAYLERRLAEASFLALPDYQHDDCTDQPAVTLSYRGRTLAHYHGDRAAPQALYDLENAIDAAVHVRRWVGQRAGMYGSHCY